MSVSATAAATAGASIINPQPHNHKKGMHLDAAAAPATTQGLFSSLLQTVEQVAGVAAPIASAAIAALKAATTTAASAASGGNGGYSPSARGAIVNTTV